MASWRSKRILPGQLRRHGGIGAADPGGDPLQILQGGWKLQGTESGERVERCLVAIGGARRPRSRRWRARGRLAWLSVPCGAACGKPHLAAQAGRNSPLALRKGPLRRPPDHDVAS